MRFTHSLTGDHDFCIRLYLDIPCTCQGLSTIKKNDISRLSWLALTKTSIDEAPCSIFSEIDAEDSKEPARL